MSGEVEAAGKAFIEDMKKVDEAMAEMKAKAVTAYRQGLEDGIRHFAWWRDGVQYVGTCNTTLEAALAEIAKGEYDE